MPFTTNKSVRIHWEERGAGTPILLVMGHRYSGGMWYPIIDELAAKHRVIWFDNRGTGQTDTVKGFEVSDMTDDAIAVMDAAGVERAHVFGVSMGGGIVLDLAVRYPQRLLSLVVGCSVLFSAEKPRMPAFMRALYYLPPAVLRALTPKRRGADAYGTNAPPEAVAHDLAVLDKDPFTVPGVVAQAAAIARHVQTKENVAAIKVPTLVIHGDEDTAVPFAYGQEVAATIPGARFVHLKGIGHNFLVGAKDESLKELNAFFDAVDAKA
ncbi:MAG: alpha/beta fold hydrolase [Caulobacteraceae bacterium]